jgi:hypothetical protein
MVLAKAAGKPEEAWQPARLIPTTGIGGQQEQEQRATSSLLAVMYAVPEFGRAIVQHLGAPAGRLTSYTEIRFETGDQKLAIPDGALVVERGRTRWVCLVEVKTGGAPLNGEQVSRYLDLARLNGFDAVLTISNQITASPLESPVGVDGRRLKKVALRHLSWWQVMTEARLQHRYHGISDPDQEWILGELIAYLDHPGAGAGGFDDMGDKWVAVRDGARQHTLRLADPSVRDVASRWEQFVQYLALGLCQDLGRNVAPLWPKRLEPGARLDQAARGVVEAGRLQAAIGVPDAVAPIELQADLAARLFTTSVELAAPGEGRPRTRLNWLLRQLAEAPDELRVEARYPNVKETISGTLKGVRTKPDAMLYAPDAHRNPRAFRVSLSRELGAKRGKGPGSFVRESRQQAIDFYRTTVQRLRPWAAAAPKLPEPAAPSMEVPPASGPDATVPEPLGVRTSEPSG